MMIDLWDSRLTGVLLIAGPVVFFVGAARWSFSFDQEMTAALRAIQAQRRRWQWINAWMIPGTILTALGVAGLSRLLSPRGETILGLIGLLLFALGAVFWIVHQTFRLSATLWAAEETASTGMPPTHYRPLAEWMGLLYTLYMVPGYLAAAALGLGLVRAELLDPWVGWAGVGIGLGLGRVRAPARRPAVRPAHQRARMAADRRDHGAGANRVRPWAGCSRPAAMSVIVPWRRDPTGA